MISITGRRCRWLIGSLLSRCLAHGLPRATGDPDAWTWPDPDNALRVLEVLDEFGFGGLEISEDDLTSPDLVIRLGCPSYRIDLLTRIEGVNFESAWQRRIEVLLDTVRVPFIGRDGLIANKRAVGRPQDIADVLRLTRDSPDDAERF
jgi:hypothetical protein